jgi:hypothetical protein
MAWIFSIYKSANRCGLFLKYQNEIGLGVALETLRDNRRNIRVGWMSYRATQGFAGSRPYLEALA